MIEDGSSPALPASVLALLGPGARRQHEALQPLAQAACQGPVKRCVVRLLDPSRHHLACVAHCETDGREPGFFLESDGAVLRLRDDTPWGQVVSTGRPRDVGTAELLGDRGTPDETREFKARLDERHGPTRSWVAPLICRRGLVGAVAFGAAAGEEIPLALIEQITGRMAMTSGAVDLEAQLDEGLRRRRESGVVEEQTAELFRIGWELSATGLAIVSPDGEVIEVNVALANILGYSPGDLAGRRATDFIAGETAGLDYLYGEVLNGNRTVVEAEHEIAHASGRRIPVATTARMLHDARGRPRIFFVAVADLSEAQRLARLRDGHRRVFDGVIGREAMSDVLAQMAHSLDAQMLGVATSILLVDASGNRLVSGVGPSLAPAYLAYVEDSVIGPDVDPCASAAFLRRTVISPDSTSDARWPGHAQVAAQHGIRAVWSAPVFGADDQVLAVLAFHFSEARTPTISETELLEDSARLVGVTVERYRERDELLRRDEDLSHLAQQQSMILDSVGDAVIGLDLEGRCAYVNAAAEVMLGWRAAELVGQDLRAAVHHSLPDGSPNPPARSPIFRCVSEGSIHEVRGDTFWDREGQSIVVDYRCSPIEINGRIRGAVLVVHQATTRARAASHPILTQRERDILRLLAKGKHGPEMGAELHISTSTLQSHLKSAISKLGASGRTHAVVLALARGELDLN